LKIYLLYAKNILFLFLFQVFGLGIDRTLFELLIILDQLLDDLLWPLFLFKPFNIFRLKLLSFFQSVNLLVTGLYFFTLDTIVLLILLFLRLIFAILKLDRFQGIISYFKQLIVRLFLQFIEINVCLSPVEFS
jgi:hypothetical protein